LKYITALLLTIVSPELSLLLPAQFPIPRAWSGHFIQKQLGVGTGEICNCSQHAAWSLLKHLPQLSAGNGISFWVVLSHPPPCCSRLLCAM